MRRSAYRGCLLGMAVGDAMGYPVNSRTWREIQEDFGPNGLQGYDLRNGYADVTSCTQLAAFACNGLLLGLTEGQLTGTMAPYINYIAFAAREWAYSQTPYGRPKNTRCWLTQQEDMCSRSCLDPWMKELLLRGEFGTIEEPRNNNVTPGSLTMAVGVGLFFERNRIDMHEVDRLGAEAVALTHGGAEAFLSGSILAHIISSILMHPKAPLKKVVLNALKGIRENFGPLYSQTYRICELIRYAVAYAENMEAPSVKILEQFHCQTAAEVLAAAIYACLVSREDFDLAMITAVNHSGCSAAVGAVAGAILGARLGEEALPEFYIECLEPAETLRSLADDLHQGCPMEQGSKFHDDDWAGKYLHGGR